MSEAATPMHFAPTLPPEEVARANFYALLARLFYAPPDGPLLSTLAGSGELDAEGGMIAEAWHALTQAAAHETSETAREEYDTAFIGVGKSPVTLYTSAYSMRYTNEVPLAALRAELAKLRIARREQASEPEDHIAALCEVMRLLIEVKKSTLEEQKRFFETWIWPSVEPLCDAIAKSGTTRFYKSVGQFLLALCTIEHSAFEML